MADHNTVTHPFISLVADDPDTTLVRPTNWNKEHIFNGGSDGQYLRYDSGQSDHVIFDDVFTRLPFVSVKEPPYNAVGDGVADDRGAIASADSVAQTISFPAGTYLIGSDLTLSSGLILMPGSELSIGGGVTLTIQGQVIASTSQIFSGAGSVVFDDAYRGEILVDWFGAGVATDATASINKAIASLPLHGTLRFSRGQYSVTGALTPFFTSVATGVNSPSVRIVGSGQQDTQILFNPAGATTLLSFDAANVSSRFFGCAIENISVYSSGTHNKTILYLGNVDKFELRDVVFDNTAAGSTDTGSIGLYIDKNPQACSFYNVSIFNFPQCIAMGSAGTPQTVDHLYFYNLFCLQVNYSAVHTKLIEVADGTALQSVEFHGTIGVGGNGLFKWDSQTTPTGDVSRALVFSGGRYEDGGFTTAGHTFLIAPHSTRILTNLTIENMSLGHPGTGFVYYFRNVFTAVIKSVYNEGNSSGTLFDIDTSDNILFLGSTGLNNVPTEVVGSSMRKVLGTGRSASIPQVPEPFAYYQNTIKDVNGQYFQVLDDKFYNVHTSLTSGTALNIPPGNSAVVGMHILVGFNANGGTAGGGHFVIFADTADTTSIKLSGTANCVAAAPGGGEVGVYRNSGDGAIKVSNGSGVTKVLNVMVFYK